MMRKSQNLIEYLSDNVSPKIYRFKNMLKVFGDDGTLDAKERHNLLLCRPERGTVTLQTDTVVNGQPFLYHLIQAKNHSVGRISVLNVRQTSYCI